MNFNSVVRGHHVYKDVWMPFTGEELTVQQDNDNEHDDYSVGVLKDSVVVGPGPKSSCAVPHGGLRFCEVTRHRKFGNGLEAPCKYSFTGGEKII